MSEQPTMAQRYEGALLGMALGDALGRPLEFLDEDLIKAQFGPQGLTEPPDPALFSDDTQLMLATAEGLLDAGDEAVPRVVEAVRDRYLVWARLQDNPVHRRAPGVAVMDALQRIGRGYNPTVAADAGPNDSITATRAVPVALSYHGDVGHIATVAAEISRLTHPNPAAVAAGSAAALLVEYALSGRPPDEWPRKCVLHLKRWCPDDVHVMAETLHLMEDCRDWPEDDAMETLGRSRPGFGGGWTAEESVALGLWYFLNSTGDYTAAVAAAANAPGDSDSDGIASITGALAGAWLGSEALPKDWLERLEECARIRSTAEALYAHT